MSVQQPLLRVAPPGSWHASSELRSLWSLAWPVALTSLCQGGISLTDLSVVGHLDTSTTTDFLAAASIAVVWQNVSLLLLLRGLGSALQTLTSQAVGANQRPLAALWLQQALVWASLSTLPVAALWGLGTGPALTALGIETRLVALCVSYCRVSVISLWPWLSLFLLQSWFQSMRIVLPALLTNALFLVVNAGLNLVLVFGVPHTQFHGFGFIGAPMATATTAWLSLAFYAWYTLRHHRFQREYWSGWRLREAMCASRCKEFLWKQTLPNLVAAALEEYQFQAVSVMAVFLGDAQLAAMNASLEMYMFLSAFMFGLSTANNIKVAQYLGGNQPVLAHRLSRLSYLLSLGVGVVIAGLMWLCREWIGSVFSKDHEVQDFLRSSAGIFGACYVGLSVFYASMSTLDAQGRPHLIALSFFLGAWGVSVPLSYAFAFAWKFDFLGLWYGLACGYAVVTLLVTWIVLRTDWEEQARQALRRSEVMPKEGAVGIT